MVTLASFAFQRSPALVVQPELTAPFYLSILPCVNLVRSAFTSTCARAQMILPLFTTKPSRAEIAAHSRFSASGNTSDLEP